MPRRHIACQAACLIRNKCRGRATRRPYVRLCLLAYVTRSRPRGSIESPPGRGVVAYADRPTPGWAWTRVDTGPPPDLEQGLVIFSPRVPGPSCRRPGPHREESGTRPGGPGCACGGPEPHPEVRSTCTGVRHFLMGSGPTVDILEHIVFSGHMATPEPPTWWGRALFTTRLEVASAGIASSYCSKGYPCFRVSTDAMVLKAVVYDTPI
jgi:hypothetical protein